MERIIEVLTDPLRIYFKEHDLIWLSNNVDWLLPLVFLVAFPLIYKLISWRLKVSRRNATLKDLHPYYTKKEVIDSTKNFINTKCQNVSSANQDEPNNTFAFVTKEELIPFFLKKAFKSDSDDHRFYFILADSGMGKTTFMINLYQQYVSKVFNKGYDIKLIPLGIRNVDAEIEKLKPNSKNTILLLDAFDEDDKAAINYQKRIFEIIDMVWDFREVIFTCRTQFFPSEIEEPNETGIVKFASNHEKHIFKKLYISPFDNKDISKYLKRKYSLIEWKKRKAAKTLVLKARNLVVRPMLLNYIDDLILDEKNYEYSFEIYEKLIEKWIIRETNRVPSNRKKTFSAGLSNFSKKMALKVYESHWLGLKEFFINSTELNTVLEDNNFDLESWEATGRSLLNRNAEGGFKFAHKSILEYFLALEVFSNQELEKGFDFESFSNTSIFFGELIMRNYRVSIKEKLATNGNKDLIGLDIQRNLTKVEVSRVCNWLIRKYRSTKFLDYLSPKFKSEVQTLEIRRGTIPNINSIPDLINLETLWIGESNLVDIKPLSKLENITELSLFLNEINNIDGLAMLKNLIKLNLGGNNITTLKAIKDLKGITGLWIWENKISSIDEIELMKGLEVLNISHNQISDISKLANLKSLADLHLYGNPITNFEPLYCLPSLKHLTLDDEQIEKINLKRLKELSPVVINTLSDRIKPHKKT